MASRMAFITGVAVAGGGDVVGKDGPASTGGGASRDEEGARPKHRRMADGGCGDDGSSVAAVASRRPPGPGKGVAVGRGSHGHVPRRAMTVRRMDRRRTTTSTPPTAMSALEPGESEVSSSAWRAIVVKSPILLTSE